MMKNASTAGLPTTAFPYSKMKHAIADCLKKEGYIAGISKKMRKSVPVLEVELVYVNGVPKIHDVERISKQSRRVYMGASEIRPIKNNFGLLVLSTPKGILSGKDAKKELVGGEALFKIW